MSRRKLLTPQQRNRLLALPRPDELSVIARFYTFSAQDKDLIRQQPGAQNRLGYALILAFLRYPGYPLKLQHPVPDHLLNYIAGQLEIDPTEYLYYAQTRAETRREHLRAVRKAFGFRQFTPGIRRQLHEILFALALTTSRSLTLVEAALEQLRRWHIVFPAFSTIEDLCGEIQQQADESVYHQLTHSLSALQQHQVFLTLEKRRTPEFTYLGWLKQPPKSPTPSHFKEILERITYIRQIDLPSDLHSRLHPNRLDELYQEAKRYSAWRLDHLRNDRRSLATLVAFLIEQQAQLTDQALNMHIQMTGHLMNTTENRQKRQWHQDRRIVNRKLDEYARLGRAFITAGQQGQDLLAALLSVMSWEAFVSSIETVEQLVRPADFDFLVEVRQRYTLVRQYTPLLWHEFTFEGSQTTVPLRRAIRLLKELDQRQERELPDWAPTGFVSKRWQPLVLLADGQIDRTNYELCVLTELSHRLRSGDIWLKNSNQFRALSDYFIPDQQWKQMQQQHSIPLPLETDFKRYLETRLTHLHERLSTVDTLLSKQAITGAEIRNGKLVLTRSTDPAPDNQQDFSDRVDALFPFIKITDLLLEVDASTQFTHAFTHLRTGEQIAEEDRITC